MEATLARIDGFERDYKAVTDALFDKFAKTMGITPKVIREKREPNKIVQNGAELNLKKRTPICNCGPEAKAHLRKETCPQE